MFHKEKNRCTSYTKRKINMQQDSPTTLRTQQDPWTKISDRTQRIP